MYQPKVVLYKKRTGKVWIRIDAQLVDALVEYRIVDHATRESYLEITTMEEGVYPHSMQEITKQFPLKDVEVIWNAEDD